MTLIMAMASPQVVCIAADRMLSVGRNGTAVKRSAIKLVLYSHEMVFGYTGYAELPDEKGKWHDTGVWLAHVLARSRCGEIDRTLGTIAEAVEEATARAMRSGRIQQLVRQEFLGVGWHKYTREAEVVADPIFGQISNSRDDRGEVVAPGRTFRATIYSVPADTIIGRSAGVALAAEENAKWQDDINRRIGREYLGEQIIGSMVASIRRTSALHKDHHVGKDVLAAAIPREAALAEPIIVAGPSYGPAIMVDDGLPPRLPPPAAHSYFFRYPEDRDEGIYEAPHVVCPGRAGFGMCLKSFKGGKQPDGSCKGTVICSPDGKQAGWLSFSATFQQKKAARENRKRKRLRPRR